MRGIEGCGGGDTFLACGPSGGGEKQTAQLLLRRTPGEGKRGTIRRAGQRQSRTGAGRAMIIGGGYNFVGWQNSLQTNERAALSPPGPPGLTSRNVRRRSGSRSYTIHTILQRLATYYNITIYRVFENRHNHIIRPPFQMNSILFGTIFFFFFLFIKKEHFQV